MRMQSNVLGKLLLALFLSLYAILWAESAMAADADAAVTYANRRIVTLHATIGALTPQARVQQIAQRLDDIPTNALLLPLTTESFVFEGMNGVAVVRNQRPLLVLFDGDLDPGSPPLAQVAQTVAHDLQAAMRDRFEQASPRRLAIGVAASLAASALFALGCILLIRSNRAIYARLDKRTVELSRLGVFHWRVLLVRGGHILSKVTAIAGMFLMAYVWLAFVLTRFPYTRHWGEGLAQSIVTLLGEFAGGIVEALPDIAAVALILFITRIVSRLLMGFFDHVEARRITLPGLHPETIGATRRLSLVLLWVFALTLVYPRLPGANTDAFRGVSVFMGLMLTLGSAGLVNHAMSGLVLVYSRALRPGDRVMAGDAEGLVLELGALSTKLRTAHDEEVTLPNSVVVGAKIVNASRLTRSTGIMLATQVAVGYNAPWRQVHAMLELAARRTQQINQTFTPQVVQIALEDFSVRYELRARMLDDAEPTAARGALHANIQDIFNEFGVQIMTPNFEDQPDEPVIAPPESWYAAPASK